MVPLVTLSVSEHSSSSVNRNSTKLKQVSLYIQLCQLDKKMI